MKFLLCAFSFLLNAAEPRPQLASLVVDDAAQTCLNRLPPNEADALRIMANVGSEEGYISAFCRYCHEFSQLPDCLNARPSGPPESR